MTIPKKENRGGKRPNSGRPKLTYQKKTVSFRVKADKENEIKDHVNEYLKTNDFV